MQITGSEAIVRVLEEEGTEVVFGYPGGSVIPLYNALYDAKFHNVLTVHEQGAVHAADGYSRASGKVGICIATAGPGATNLVTGLATAYLDSIPIVAITGQVAQPLIGKDAFQEVDIVSVTLAVTKYNVMVSHIDDLVPTLKYAFKLAKSGRPGPVLIDIPSSIQNSMLDWEVANLTPVDEIPHDDPLSNLNLVQTVQEIKRIIDKSTRPVLVVGGGVVQADVRKFVQSFIDRTDIPVTSTLMGLGGFDCNHERYLGLTGMHGHKAANLAIVNADVVLVVGSRFSDRVTGNKEAYVGNKQIIQFDIDYSEMNKNINTHIGILGDLQETLPMLLRQPWQKLAITPWLSQIKTWQKEHALPPSDKLTAPSIMQHINDLFSGQDVTYVTDVGQNQMWAAQHLNIAKTRGHITSGGCGTMGFSVPASIGAKFANPKGRVISIAGDGGFKMTGMEIYTAVREGLPLISIVINNYCLGMVRQWQHLFYDKRYSSTILGKGFDFVGFAQSCGAQAYKATTQAEFKEALSKAATCEGVVVIEACIACGEMVEPMVAPGMPLNSFVNVCS